MDAVLAFCQPRLARRVFAVKGAAGNRAIITPSKTRGARLMIVGVDGVKSQIMNRLTGQKPTVRFSDGLEPRFYEELTSERLVTRYSRGAPVRRWERVPGKRAESLDCVVYGWAVKGLASRTSVTTGEKPPTARRIIKSNWLAGV